MEQSPDHPQEGFVFKPALQDISLKRFRIRYCVTNNCYYLHWDNTVCPQLARIVGLERGAHSVSHLKRYHDDSKEMSFLSCENGASSGEIQWKIDFSNCGLVINRLKIKGRWEGEGDSSVVWTLTGDNRLTYGLYLGERVIEMDELAGCKSVTLTASVTMETDSDPAHLLTGNINYPHDCPLDISGDLMCARRDDVPYIGELLLGLKFTPDPREDNDGDEEETEMSAEGEGQLQVHIVEGAGLVDGETHKPFNASVKCDLLPDPRRYSVKQTSPKHNAYPTWSKEFFFAGLKRSDIVIGGLEVILYDHRRVLHDAIVGGIRLSVPLKNDVIKTSPDASPARSRSNSPADIVINGQDDSPMDDDQASPTNLSPAPFSKSKSLPGYYHDQTSLSPLLRRARSPTPKGSPLVSPNTLSPVIHRRDRSPSPSPKGSPLMAARNLFRLSGSHLRELSSPISSPILGRKNRRSRSPKLQKSIDSEYLYWWMDSSGDEVKHWQQVMDNEGKWIYCWHTLRPKLKPAYST